MILRLTIQASLICNKKQETAQYKIASDLPILQETTRIVKPRFEPLT